jgi:hypothetical protein
MTFCSLDKLVTVVNLFFKFKQSAREILQEVTEHGSVESL